MLSDLKLGGGKNPLRNLTHRTLPWCQKKKNLAKRVVVFATASKPTRQFSGFFVRSMFTKALQNPKETNNHILFQAYY